MPPDLTSEAWAQIRHDYEHTDKPVHDICLEHGTTPNTLRDRVRRWGWTPRHVPIPREGPPPTPAPRIDHPVFLSPVPRIETAAPSPEAAPRIDTAAPSPPAAPHVATGDVASAPADPTLIVPRLQGAVARVLPAIEAILARLGAGPMHPHEMERAGRALSSLTRTLRELNTLLSQQPARATCYCDDMPEDIDAFRLDFARRIELFVKSREADEGAEPPET